MSFGQRFVNLQCPGGRGLGLRQSLARRRRGCSATKPAIAVSQTGVGQGISRIFVDRLLEILDTFLVPVGGGLIFVIPALQVKLISLCVGRVGFSQTCFLFAGEPNPQIPRDCACNFLLHGRDVGHPPVVLLTPELFVLARVHQFGAHRKLVASLKDSAL